jgi:hypothetical protein
LQSEFPVFTKGGVQGKNRENPVLVIVIQWGKIKGVFLNKTRQNITENH